MWSRHETQHEALLIGAGDFVLPTADATGTKKQVKATEVSDKVDRILSDSSYKENSMRISEKLRSYGGASYAASLIEELVHGLDKMEIKNI